MKLKLGGEKIIITSMKEITKLLNGCKTVVFMDFEGTQFSQEIIAIGAFKCDLDNKNQIKTIYPGFKYYVKSHGEVGRIVTKLTGITDEKIEQEGINFLFCMKYFQNYVNKSRNVKYITYGNFDMRLLHQSQSIEKMEDNAFIKSIYRNYIDFSTLLGKYVKSDKGTNLSLTDALKVFNITPEGEHHDPLFDAKNLMFLYREFLKQRGTLMDEYKKVLFYHSNYPQPIAKMISQLKTKGSVDINEFEKIIEDSL